MKRISCLLLSVIAVGMLAAQSKTPESMLGAALHQEEVQRDIKGAISSYKKLLATRGLNRKVSAEALFHLGLCYQKLGDADARKTFERLVNEYGDTSWAAQARPRIMALESGRAINRQTATQLWQAEIDCEGTISHDGRYAAYTDWKTGNMAFRDLLKGTDFPVTKTGTWKKGAAEFAETAAFSRDGKEVAYQWFEGKAGRFELRITAASGEGTPRSLFHSEEFRWVAPHDWSPDGKWIAVGLEPENSDARTYGGIKPGQKAAIGLVAVQDGSLRILTTNPWLSQDSGYGHIRFSPDGKMLAYDRPPTDPQRWWQRNVFVRVIEEGREIPVAVASTQEQLVGWSPDGSRVLFNSDRTGSIDLWSVSISNGKPQGNPELLRQGVGRIIPFRLNTAGQLHYCVSAVGDLPVSRIATLDFHSGKLTSEPVDLTQADHGEGSISPAWSPDGKTIAFISRRQIASGHVASIKIQSTETGEIRELHPMLYAPFGLLYAPDGRSLLINQSGPMVRIDLQTGAISPLVQKEGARKDRAVFSKDGRTLYYARQEFAKDAEVILIARDLASGSERELLRRKTMSQGFVSPDGRYLIALSYEPQRNSGVLSLVTLETGVAREIPLSMGTGAVSPFSWTPDSQAFLFRRRLSEADVELWRFSLDQGTLNRIEEKLDPQLANAGGIRLHPDGRRVLLMSPERGPVRSQSQIMVLENFLPSATAEKSAAR